MSRSTFGGGVRTARPRAPRSAAALPRLTLTAAPTTQDAAGRTVLHLTCQRCGGQLSRTVATPARPTSRFVAECSACTGPAF